MATLIFYLEDGTTLNHMLDEGTTTIGRHPDSVVVLEFASVSGHHAEIELSESGCFVTDLKSSNGTRVNGVEIEEAQLKNGDRLHFGDVQAAFTSDDAPPPAAYVPPPQVMTEAPPPSLATSFRPPVAPPRGSIKRSDYSGSSGGGCGTAIVVVLLFIAAALSGLYFRHHKETGGGNFFKDLKTKMSSKVPTIKVEKKTE